MRTLGMIGGTSWHSTIEYYQQINTLVGQKIGAQANPPLIIYSINIELMREQNINKINAKYLDVSQKLIDAGAEAILICANTPHMVYDFVQPKISKPILHIAEAIGKEAQRLQLQTLALFGNRPTMTKGFIPKYLKSKFEIDTVIPNEKIIDQSHYFVSKQLTQGQFTEQAKTFYLNEIKQLNTVDGIILGCTELPLLLKQSDVNSPLIATTDLHIQMAVDFILN